MNYNAVTFILVAFIWIAILISLHKINMRFFKFLVGCVGMFTIMMVFFAPYLEQGINILISYTLNAIGACTNYFQVFKENSIVTFDTKGGIVSVFINYECSGIIEMLVFTSLAAFFPFTKTIKRIVSILLGNLYIFVANIIRILFIISLTKLLGTSAYYLIHTLFARILFFALMIILYYYVFTTTQLKYQNVGEIK